VRFTERELDFVTEGLAAERLSRGMSPYGTVPGIHWNLTTKRLLTMDYAEGETFLTLCQLHESGRTDEIGKISPVDLDLVVSHLAQECFRQLFSSGFFHGDPHPANVILRNDGTFVFLDCGITGDLHEQHRRDLSGFVENLARGKFDASAQYYTRLCTLTAETDLDAWRHDVSSALASWYRDLIDPRAQLADRHMGNLQGKIAVAMRRHHVRTRQNLLLFWRALVLLDTTTLRLPTRFDLVVAMRSFFTNRQGHPAATLLALSRDSFEEALRLRDTVAPAIRLLDDSGPRVVRVVVSSRRGNMFQPPGRRVGYAVVGAALGASAGAGESAASAVAVLASLVLLILASRG